MSHLDPTLALRQLLKALTAMKVAWKTDVQCFQEKVDLFSAIEGEIPSIHEKVISSGYSNDPYFGGNFKMFMENYKESKGQLKKPQDLVKVVGKFVNTIKRLTSKVKYHFDASHIPNLAFNLAHVSEI